VEVGFRGAGGDAHGYADFIVRIALDIVEDEDGPRLCRQGGDPPFKVHACIGRRFPSGDLEGLQFARRLEACGAPACGAEIDQHNVHGEAMQPGSEGTVLTEAAKLLPGADESVLRERLRPGHIRHHTQTQGINATDMRPVQLLERGRIAGLRALHEVGGGWMGVVKGFLQNDLNAMRYEGAGLPSIPVCIEVGCRRGRRGLRMPRFFLPGITKRFVYAWHHTIRTPVRVARQNLTTNRRDDMKRNHTRAILSLAFVLLAVGTAATFQGGFYLRAEYPTQAGSVLAIQAKGCERPENARVIGAAEGLVDGVRQTLPITLTSRSKGLYEIAWERPEDGDWVLTLTGTYRGAVSSLIVPVAADGKVRLPEPDRYGTRIEPVHRTLTAADINSALEKVAVAG